ncbi:precorrin-2 dehydrogenase/sirohydrochlorin ferrochelatase family protein [Tissierella praeacuta]|uniref:precorrin-2 dehydrogenase/sirohydrochlorin ferrochelatase family protein n=1 Tax=Tissierella praeacuta TaxID=43131 RepID=UPI000EEDC9EF|nr:bifunctional precorrin-2 dehydrogenase/sirohydrochlorin ferrochelatase [Tissierella praeacuta]HAE92331.1 siroheme synthase [Tissierella sp.]
MFYPIMIDISNKCIIIVGGGEVAHRKARKLLEFGGKLMILSPCNIPKFEELKERYKENLDFIYDEYNKKYIEDAFLVIGATSSKKINKQISEDCKSLNILVNIVDSREDSDFITPSIINNDTLTISISTMGSFPYLSKKIRMDMEDSYKKFNKEYLDILEELRHLILHNYREEKKEIMDYALNLNIDELKELLIKLRD